MDIHEFLPGLYGGGRLDLDPRGWSFIRSHVDVVVNLRQEPDAPPFDFTGRKLVWAPILDNQAPDLHWLRDMIHLLNLWLDAGHCLYIHDTNGINPLGFLVTALLMERCGFSLDQALTQTRRIKSDLHPKPTYLDLLRRYEADLKSGKQQRDGLFRVKADVWLDPETLASLIRKHYGMTVRSLEKVRGVYRVETDEGEYGFKKADELPDLPLIADCLRKIAQKGFKRIPGLVVTPENSLMIHFNGEPYFMEQWLDLEEIPKHSLPYFEKLGASLAEFHDATHGIPPPKRGSSRNRWGKHRDLLADASKRLETWNRPLRSHPSPSDPMNFLTNRCRRAQQAIRNLSMDTLLQHPGAAVWCHSALQHRNIMLDRQGEIWFIDFETLVFAERVKDLAHLLEYHAAPYGWPLSAVQRFLSAYESRAATPLSRDEWALLYAHLTFPRRLYKRMKRCYTRSKPRSKDWQELRKLLKSEGMKEDLLHRFASVFP